MPLYDLNGIPTTIPITTKDTMDTKKTEEGNWWLVVGGCEGRKVRQSENCIDEL
jgi:hypothetical protein